MVNMLASHIGHITSRKELIALRHTIDKRIEHLCETIGCDQCKDDCHKPHETQTPPKEELTPHH